MEGLICKSTAIFAHPFIVPGFDEALPAGEYDLETEISAPPNHMDPDGWKASVLVHLRPHMTHPGLARSLTISLADLESARAKDKWTGKELAEFFLEEMLADPMIRLVMRADGASEAQIRHLYANSRTRESGIELCDQDVAVRTLQSRLRQDAAIQRAENEGMPSPAELPLPRWQEH